MTADESEIAFAFIRPLWLLGLLFLPGLGWAWSRVRGANGWENYIDAGKLAYLNIETSTDRTSMRGIVIGCLALGLIALAGPSWRTIPLPVQQTRDAMVIAFDLSPSMLASDLNPDRLTRARLKIIDLLRLRREGETALIAYADDAYRVSPLTDDTTTIEALVPSLHPNIMPAPGSQVEAAVVMARDLLAGASIERGVLLIVTDGIDPSAIPNVEEELGDSLSLCILTVGTREGVPIPMPGGGFARDASNQTILASVNRGDLEALASRNGGCYAEIQPDDSDLDRIFRKIGPAVGDDLEESETTFDIRHDEGYWLVVFLLPIVALAFRRNIFWMLIVTGPGLLFSPNASVALEWADLWQRADQREIERLEGGVEAYRQGNYEAAAETFRGDSVLHHYNRGNSLALQGNFDEAIESYDRALESDASNADAQFNRDVIEKLLEEQEQNQDSQGDEGDDSSESDDQSQDSQSSENSSPSDESDDSGESEESEPSSASSDEAEPEDETQDSAEESNSEGSEESENSDEQEGTAEESPEESSSEPPADAAANAAVEDEQEPLSDQSEQWLRNIPDDPGGLMRRKFQYQAETRRQRGARPRPDTRY